MEIPPDQLSAAALQGIIESYVTLEGTEYGWEDVPLETKVQQVMAQLKQGKVVIRFDPESRTCGLFCVE